MCPVLKEMRKSGREGERRGEKEVSEKQEWGTRHYWVTKGRVGTHLLKVSLMSWEKDKKREREKEKESVSCTGITALSPSLHRERSGYEQEGRKKKPSRLTNKNTSQLP